MGGTRLRFSSDSVVGNSQDLYSNPGKPSHEPSRRSHSRFFHRFSSKIAATLIVAMTLGDPLTGGAMREAAAQPTPKVDAKTTIDLTNDTGAKFDRVKKALAAVKLMGGTSLPFSDPAVRELLTSLSNANEKLKPAYGGKDSIPISGSNDEERVKSLNVWLAQPFRDRPAMSRKPEDPLDSDAINELQLRTNLVILKPGASAIGQDIRSNIGTATPVVVNPPGGAGTRVASQIVASKPALSDERRTEYERLYENLEVITQYGSRGDRDQAKALREKLRAILDNPTPTDKQLSDAEKNVATPARKMMGRPLDAAQKKKLEASHKDFGVSDDEALAYMPEIKSMYESLKAVRDDTSKPQSLRDMASDLMGKLTDIWKLGEREMTIFSGLGDQRKVVTQGTGPRWDLAAMHKRAAAAIIAGDETNGRLYSDLSKTFFNRWEQYMANFLVPDAIGTADDFFKRGIADKNNPNHLPTTAELSKRKLLQRSKATKNRASVDNGSESLEKDARARYDNFKRYVAANPNALSFNIVRDFYKYMTQYTMAVTRLQDIYVYYQAHLPSDPTQREQKLQSFLSSYSKSALVMIDPTYNPIQFYTPPEKAMIRREYGAALGKPNITLDEVMQLLNSVPSWRFDEAIYSVFKWAVQVAPPVPDSLKPAAQAWAKLRAARYYFTHETFEMRDYENDDNRMEFGKLALNTAIDAVKKSGLPEAFTKDLIDLANNWLKVWANPSKDDKRAVADEMVDVASGIVTLCEKELLYQNSGLRPGLAPKGSDAEKKARTDIDTAKAEFLRVFVEPRILTNLYPALSRQMADHTTEILNPPSFEVTESYARANMALEFDNALTRYYKLADEAPKKVTAPDRDRLTTDVQIAERAKKIAAELDRLKRKDQLLLDAIATLKKGDLDNGLEALSKYVTDIYGKLDAQSKVKELDQVDPALDRAFKKVSITKENSLPAEADAWDARKKDAPGAIQAAADIELSHINLVVNQPPFNPAPLSDVLSLTPGRMDVRSMADSRISTATLGDITDEFKSNRRITRDIADFRMGNIQIRPGATQHQTHESPENIQLGPLFMELRRQWLLHRDLDFPALLKTLDTAPDQMLVRSDPKFQKLDEQFKTRVQEIGSSLKDLGFKNDQSFLAQLQSIAYDVISDPKLTPAQQLERVNRIFLALLDARIAQLEARLGGVRTTDGIPIMDLGDRKRQNAGNPNAWRSRYVERAQEGLLAARALRANFKAEGGNLFAGRTDPKQTIMIVEEAIDSVSDDNINQIPKPNPTQQPTLTLQNISAQLRYPTGGGQKWGIADAMITPPGSSEPMLLGDYLRNNNVKTDITYSWFYFADMDGSGQYWLMNPNYRPGSTNPSEQEPVLGKVVDGQVLKVMPLPHMPSLTEQWEVEMSGGKPIVLFYLSPAKNGGYTFDVDTSDSVKYETLKRNQALVSSSSKVPTSKPMPKTGQAMKASVAVVQ